MRWNLSSKGKDSDITSSLSNCEERIPSQGDIVIVGGGLAGLSAALYVTQMDPSRQVTILDAEPLKTEKTNVASFAAAGMLAPQSERLTAGPLLDICLESRKMYPEFIDLVQNLASTSKEKGEPYRFSDNNDWSVGYMACGGFLAPAFAGDAVATWAPPESTSSVSPQWLDETQIRQFEPHLSPKVIGGWWFPEDASVDARRLTQSLRASCAASGVKIRHSCKVTSLDLQGGKCQGLWLTDTNTSGSKTMYMSANQVMLANGAWMRHLLPVPLESHKGQSLSLKMPNQSSNSPPLLSRVLFGQDSYICPKEDGRIIVGATVEAGSWDAKVTPAGLLHILDHALELVPALADLELEETWVGLRPTTPDRAPILGNVDQWENLYLAGGYWRNGVLLAPKTGYLMAKLLTQPTELTEQEHQYLQAFEWNRFSDSTTSSHQMRYAASLNPVHRQVLADSSSVELGSHTSARVSRKERQADLSFLEDPEDDAGLQLAAQMGRQDAEAFAMGVDDIDQYENDDDIVTSATTPLEEASDTLDALTVGGIETEGSNGAATIHEDLEDSSSSEADDTDSNLQGIYANIQKNKDAVGLHLDANVEEDTRPDPGFRIYYHPPGSEEEIEVPPYTQPAEFFEQLKEKENSAIGSNGTVEKSLPAPINGVSGGTDDYGETTFDGYQDIMSANSRKSREEELHAMREARRQNRLGETEEGGVDESKIGASGM